jgi:hypothetical protein
LAATLREQLTEELAGFVGPSLLGRRGYIQIQRLRVRLVIRGRTIDKRQIMDGLVRAICKELFTALAYPEAGGQFEVKRWESPEQFRAHFLLDFLAGSAGGQWHYRRYAALAAKPRGEAVFAVLNEAPGALIEQLAACDGVGSLPGALAVLDQFQLEMIVQTIQLSGRVSKEMPSTEDLRAVAAAYAILPLSRSIRLNDRAHALLRFVAAWRQGLNVGPRSWLTCTTVLQILSENGELLSGSERATQEIVGRPLPPEAEPLIAMIRASSESRREAAALVERAGLPKPVIAQQAAWLEMEQASLLLLVGPLIHLGWHRQWRADSMELQCWLYALACQVRGEFDPALKRFNRAAGLFAGIEGDSSLAAMRQIYASGTGRTQLSETAGALLARVKSLLPGFRKAQNAAIVRQFLNTAGRVQVSRDAILAVLDPNPFWIAAHLAGLDGKIEAVPWFRSEDSSRKTLEIRLEGL